MGYRQEGRILQIQTPLGDDVLLVESLDGKESLSELYVFDLELSSLQPSIDPQAIVGKNVTIYFKQLDGTYRYYNGFVNRFWYVGRNDLLSLYRAEVVPWLWFLTRATNCRIFENMNVVDIVTKVFTDLGFNDFEMELNNTYPPMEYCVQYRETDYNFVSRLLETAGIFYFFRQEETKHTLHLADGIPAYQPCAENQVECSEQDNFSHIITWEHGYEYRSGKASNTDYNFETPTANLLASVNTLLTLDNISAFDLFDYPGKYKVKSEGDALAKMRVEEDESAYDLASGKSRCRSFFAGGTFTLSQHPDPAEQGRSYVLTSVHHHTELSGDYTTAGPKSKAPKPGEARPADKTATGSTEGELDYTNDFIALPLNFVFRPKCDTPKAVVQGAQTAVVVGPSGSEIYTDKYGRVKVQFFWDRETKQSCWLRVSNIWAGNKWGGIFIPRVGQEVIVEFLEGDPDRPIITGCVYNADQMPPYDLPANATQSGIKTRSSADGSDSNFNELRFEDKKGEEQVFMQAERNRDTVVKNDQTLDVGHDLTSKIKNDEKRTVGGNYTLSVTGDLSEDAKDITLTAKDKVTIICGSSKIEISPTGDITIQVDGNLTENAQQITTTAQTQLTLNCGGSSIQMTPASISLLSASVTSSTPIIVVAPPPPTPQLPTQPSPASSDNTPSAPGGDAGPLGDGTDGGKSAAGTAGSDAGADAGGSMADGTQGAPGTDGGDAGGGAGSSMADDAKNAAGGVGGDAGGGAGSSMADDAKNAAGAVGGDTDAGANVADDAKGAAAAGGGSGGLAGVASALSDVAGALAGVAGSLPGGVSGGIANVAGGLASLAGGLANLASGLASGASSTTGVPATPNAGTAAAAKQAASASSPNTDSPQSNQPTPPVWQDAPPAPPDDTPPDSNQA